MPGYDLILYIECGCTEHRHETDCPIQERFGFEIGTAPGYWYISIGKFYLPVHKANKVTMNLMSKAFSQFEIMLKCPVKVVKKTGGKLNRVYVKTQLPVYGETSILYTIQELEADLGRFEHSKSRNIEIGSYANQVLKDEQLEFIPFEVTVKELRIISVLDKDIASVIEGVKTYPTLWRMKLEPSKGGYVINKARPPTPDLPPAQNRPLCKFKNRHGLCCALLVILMMLIALTAYVVFQYLEDSSANAQKKRFIEMRYRENPTLFKEIFFNNTTAGNHTTL